MDQKNNFSLYKTKALVVGVFVFLCFFLVVVIEQEVKVLDTPMQKPIETNVKEHTSPHSRSFFSSTSSKSYINVHNTIFNLHIARSPEERARGLSGRKGLGENEGMLFVFPKEGRHGIWMKDMLFAIDVLWLNTERKVVHIVENMKPSSYPKTYYPETSALFVIELPVYTVLKTKVKVGDIIGGDVFEYEGR